MENNTEILTLPLIALRGRVIFPNTFINFDVGRDPSLKALDAAKGTESLVFLAAQKSAAIEKPTVTDINTIGVVAKINQIVKSPDKDVKISVHALYRAQILGYTETEEKFVVKVARRDYVKAGEIETLAYLRIAKGMFAEIATLYRRLHKDVVARLLEIADSDEFIDNALSVLSFKEDVCQIIFTEDDSKVRLEKLIEAFNTEIEISKIERRISNKVRTSIDKSQREFYLREQLKAIHSELGDDQDEKQKLKEEILEKKLPSEIEEKALKEIARLDKINPSSPDYSIILNYLDWIKELPFSKVTEETAELSSAIEILNADHFGLDKVKERIIEYLAVYKLTNALKGPILCFVGPPGVGKTSVASSIARALNRKFVRMSLGGVRDEAEIRGHRRTYVGAMPGRIIFGLKQAGSSNPVFLLDEIDKLSNDIHGDPASALLEVLDPEQNCTFRDRFMEIPYDLSKVLFITTANTLDTIPRPLLDRMEVIELNGYTQEEKLQIAKQYLTSKQIKNNGLNEGDLEITDGALKEIIEGYTMEAGVRNLEREIGAVVRKIAVNVATNGKNGKVTVTEKEIPDLLGIKKYIKDELSKENEIGVATGLAWTAIGGTTLSIEVGLMKGKGEIRLTGKLGDVMKESASTAISYIRSNSAKYGIEDDVFKDTDIHIHVPEGATPKDGPSAGITMATAILSALTKKKVNRSVAMTGEITLRGRVLPIGGLKEKTLAAYRAGVKKIIIPEENLKDLEEIPGEIKSDMDFVSVKNVDEVFRAAIGV